MLDVKWDMPLSLLQRSLYLMKEDGFRVVVKGSVAALVGKRLVPRISITLKDDSTVALLEMSGPFDYEYKVINLVRYIGTGISLEEEIASGRLVVTGPEDKMVGIINRTIGRR